MSTLVYSSLKNASRQSEKNNLLLIFGSGYLGIFLFKQNPKLKKYVNKKNLIILSLIYIIIVSFIASKSPAFGIASFILPLIISIINSFFRNKLVLKKIKK